MAEWQPIETVPEKGRFLIFGLLHGNPEPEVYEPSYVYEQNGEYRFALDHNGEYDPAYGTATHWMPLPPPPREQSANIV